jgi:hypothetical protein
MEALGKEINDFFETHLYGVINQIDMQVEGKESESYNKPQYNRYKRNNSNTRTRFSYKHCQNIFKECSKRLADVVINDDRAYLEPARQPTAAADVKRLHEDLWG